MTSAYFNPCPVDPFTTLAQLRAAMTRLNPDGADYLGYLLAGRYFDGKDLWINPDPQIKAIYGQILASNPGLHTENPYGEFIRANSAKFAARKPVTLTNIHRAPPAWQAAVAQHHPTKPVALFCGGPAPKVAAALTCLHNDAVAVRFVLDGAEQSNESNSASYEHSNHANALNADFENSGFGLLPLIVARMFKGEPDAAVALHPAYRKVDLWPGALAWRDMPIYAHNMWHGMVQAGKGALGMRSEHDKNREAAQKSALILDYLQTRTGIALKRDATTPRALSVHCTVAEHEHALRENRYLRQSLGVQPRPLSRAEIAAYYGPTTCDHIVSADIFEENQCFVHGFDHALRAIIAGHGGEYHNRMQLDTLYFSATSPHAKVVGVAMKNILSGAQTFMPVDYVALSLGPGAQYRFAPATRRRVVPHQTIASGVSCQVLFKITDAAKFQCLPHSALKQTHFVEMAATDDYLLVKLTAGGNIANPKYSRSYAISALANLLRVLTPDCGLGYVAVVAAWPCSRGINGPNNGELVRLGDNIALRTGEGGTGMSKMGHNAQTLLDAVGLPHGLPEEMVTPWADYQHSVLDRRQRSKVSV